MCLLSRGFFFFFLSASTPLLRDVSARAPAADGEDDGREELTEGEETGRNLSIERRRPEASPVSSGRHLCVAGVSWRVPLLADWYEGEEEEEGEKRCSWGSWKAGEDFDGKDDEENAEAAADVRAARAILLFRRTGRPERQKKREERKSSRTSSLVHSPSGTYSAYPHIDVYTRICL